MSRAKPVIGEQELVERIVAGDKEAFHIIYEQSYGKVARYVNNLSIMKLWQRMCLSRPIRWPGKKCRVLKVPAA